MRICDLIKNQDTFRADACQTVLEVAQAMVSRNIGAVPVLREGVLVGIFSERDLMKRVVVDGRDPRLTRVEEVMTPEPLRVGPHDDLQTCMLLMPWFPSSAGLRWRAVARGRLVARSYAARSG
jgi:signal-transduction protein with cAMP-binding, CBS, and nucleotidyltransferase domain